MATKRTNRPVGRPRTGTNPVIAIRWPPILLRGIERYAERQMLDRSVALRQIVAKFLTAKGIIRESARRVR